MRGALPIALVLFATTAVAQENPALEDPRAQALARLHPLLEQYHAEVGELPADALDLYLEGFTESASALFLPGSPEARLGATVASRSSSSFYILRSDWNGWVACTEPGVGGEVFKLHVDGRVERDEFGPGEFFGITERLPFSCEVTDEDLARPAARLGVALVEVPHHRFGKDGWIDVKGAVLVRAVIPGYRSWYPARFNADGPLRPGDRLIRVGGRRVDTLAELEAILPHLPAGRDLDVVALRDHDIVRCWALVPDLPDVEREVIPGDPALVAAAARICLEGTGPGVLGVQSVAEQGGTKVTLVVPASAAAGAGIAVGDRITAVAGHPAPSPAHLTWLIRAHAAGSRVKLELERDGARRTVEPVLGALDAGALARARFTVRENQLAVDEALPYADQYPLVSSIVTLITRRKGSSEALRWLDRALREPTGMQGSTVVRSQLLGARGRLRAENGQWKEGIADIEEGHRLAGGFGVPPDHEIADILWTWRQHAAALERYRIARQRADEHDRAAIALRVGLCLSRLGRADEARRELESIRDHASFGQAAREALEALR